MAQTVYQIASSAALPVRLWVLAGSSSCTLPRRTAPSVTSALGRSRHPGGCLPSALYPLAVVLFRSVGSAAVGFSCGSKNYRRHECAQVQRQLNRSAGSPVLAQTTGNIVGELRAAVPADERRKQLLCGAGSLRAATLGLVDQLLVITRGLEVPRGEAQQLTAALAFGQPFEDLHARLRVAVFGLPHEDGIVRTLLIGTHCYSPPCNLACWLTRRLQSHAIAIIPDVSRAENHCFAGAGGGTIQGRCGGAPGGFRLRRWDGRFLSVHSTFFACRSTARC